MSDEGEKTCPLCAEEMDLTDRQLKPCKCGYEICVWCWHNIMDMAEKDDSDGRCPACRSPYDKDKIVGMAANCERLVAEISSEKKMKSQRAKPKSTEARKQLTSVRVIQRNLVYIVGLPLNLADEELLQRKEYFGQYGKVLKVSMSRTAAGVIQQFPNNTCSVYITYLKEEEAVRCIQSVHGYVLDCRTLKACFGTTKYCHAWLRNVPCTNPDCLYLHEVGSQEDSFTKDEIISAYTRVQQITGATNNMQRRSGNALPPPVDDNSHESAASDAKPIVKNGPIVASAGITKSPPNGSSCSSLPAGASWGTHASNHPPQTSLPCSNGPSKQKNDTLCGMSAFPSVKSTNHASLHNDMAKKSFEESQTVHAKGRPDQLSPLKQNVGFNSHVPVKLDSVDGDTGASVGSRLSCAPAAKYFNRGNEVQSDASSSSLNLNKESCFTDAEKVGHVATDVSKMQSLSSNTSSWNINNEDPFEKAGIVSESVPLIKSGVAESCAEQSKQSISSAGDERTMSLNSTSVRKEGFDLRTGKEVDAAVNCSSEVDEDVLSFDNQRTKDPEVVSRLPYVSSAASSPYLSNHPRASSPLHGDGFGSVNLNSNNSLGGTTFAGGVLRGSDVPMMSSGHPGKLTGNGGSEFMRTDEIQKQMRLGIESNPTRDIGESSIISNLLSMGFDTWDESLTSPKNLAKFLGDTEQQPVSLKLPSWKVQNKNQSRFSFARQEENNSYEVEHSFGFNGQVLKNSLLPQNVTDNRDNRDALLDKFGLHNGYPSSNFEGFDKFNSSPSIFAPKSSVSRTQVSVPPGFSVPSRAPPPGFSSHNRGDQLFGNLHGNHLLDTSTVLRNSYHSPSSASIGGPGDLEFMDPAILAVGKGRLQGGLNGSGLDMRSNAAPQLNAFENEARLHLMMQRSLSPHQNLRYSDGDSFASLNDSYGITSKMMDQSQMNISQYAQLSLQQLRSSHLPGQWDNWNDVQGGNGLGMAELLRNNERLGYNKFYNGYEESKYRMPNSSGLCNRTYGV